MNDTAVLGFMILVIVAVQVVLLFIMLATISTLRKILKIHQDHLNSNSNSITTLHKILERITRS